MVITGMGLISPLGGSVAESWCALRQGCTGVHEAGHRSGPRWMRCIGEAPEAVLPDGLPEAVLSQSRFLNRGGRLGVHAATEAVRQAAMSEAAAPERRGLYVATGDFTRVACEFLKPVTHLADGEAVDSGSRETVNRAALARVNPFFLLESLHNNPFSFLAAAFELHGPSTTLGSQSPSGAQALEVAFRGIRNGRVDAALVVGCASWLDIVPLLELRSIGLLSQARDGPRSFRPFDRYRDGFLAGEGGAAIVLEPGESARKRGASVLATVEGAGASTAAGERLGVAPFVTRRAIESALVAAGRQPSDLGFACGHGSGTRAGDAAELDALLAVLGEDAALPLCGLKPATGHMGAASDVGEVILGVMAAGEGTVPPTLNFRGAEARHAAARVAPEPQRCATGRFLSVSYGMGGQASTLIVTVDAEASHRA